MKIIRDLCNPQPSDEIITLETFADQHGLTLEIHERREHRGWDRYYVYFSRCDVKDGIFLRSEFGNGATEQLAINDYATRLSGKTLVIWSGSGSTKVSVPTLIGSGLDGRGHESADSDRRRLMAATMRFISIKRRSPVASGEYLVLTKKDLIKTRYWHADIQVWTVPGSVRVDSDVQGWRRKPQVGMEGDE